MKIIQKLLLGELSKGRIACFLFTQIIGIAIIIISVQFFFDIKQALEASKSDDEYIILTKKVGMLSGLLSSDLSFKVGEIEKLKNVEGVSRIGEFISSNFGVQATVGGGAIGAAFTTEMFFESVDKEFIDVETSDWNFNIASGVVPIIVPQNYVNLYNVGFAPSTGLPRLSKGLIKGVTLNINLTDRVGANIQLKGKIVGFSSRISTILAPKEFVEWGNTVLSNKNEVHPVRLIVKIDPSRTETILSAIDSMGYELENKVFNYEKISRVIAFIVSGTLLIGVVITVLSIFLLILTLFLLIQRNKEKIFNLFILGFETKTVNEPYLKVSFYMTTVSFVFAYLLAIVVRVYYKGFMITQLGLPELSGVLWIPIVIILTLYVLVLLINRVMISKEILDIRR